MHCHRGLPAARDSLYNDIAIRGFADNLILFLLNRRDNLPEHRFLILCQILSQQLVVRDHLGIIIINQSVSFNLIGALPPKLYSADRMIGHLKDTFAKTVFIIDIRNRSPPVNDQNRRRPVRHSALPDIEGLGLPPLLLHVDSSEIRLLQRFPVLMQRRFHIVVHGNRIGQFRKYLGIIMAVAVIHILNLRVHDPDLLLIRFNIAPDHLNTGIQIRFFLPTIFLICHASYLLLAGTLTLPVLQKIRLICIRAVLAAVVLAACGRLFSGCLGCESHYIEI